MGVADCDESTGSVRSSRPVQSPCKRKNGKKGNHVGPRAPQLKEPWRKEAKARQLITEPAREALARFLDEDISVVPQGGAPCLPTITITPAEIIRHILSRMTSFVAETKPGASIFAEIYGGVAQSVVAVNNGLQVVAPTDFDARFYIPRTHNDARDFDRCRCIVEEFLVMKLRLALDGADAELFQKLPALVRTRYFQKQVVIGGALSLLSCGDPASGKGVDLEFSLNVSGDRKYFDDANSFVIPLSLQHLAGIEPVHALSMARNFDHALALASSRELLVGQPAQVVNGLSLYAHALSDKGLTPAGFGDEADYGLAMVKSFKGTCLDLQVDGKDPLRFVKSFIRSHYPGRPIACLAMVAQIMAELTAFNETAEGETDAEDGMREATALLLATQLLAAVNSLKLESEALYSLLTIVCFVRSPGDVGAVPAVERSIRVACEQGRWARLLRKPRRCGAEAVLLCRRAADALRKREPAADRWKEGVLDCICSMLESQGLPEEDASKALEADCYVQEPEDLVVAAAEPIPAPPVAPSRPMSYAAAALAAHGAKGKGASGEEASTKVGGESQAPSPAQDAAHHAGRAKTKAPERRVGLSAGPLPRIRLACDAVADVLTGLELHDIATALLVCKSGGSPAQQAQPEAAAGHEHEPRRDKRESDKETAAEEPVMSYHRAAVSACGTPRAEEACAVAGDWPSPTRSTDHAWTLPHTSEMSSRKLEQVRWKTCGADGGAPAGRVGVRVIIEAHDMASTSGSYHSSLPASPCSNASRAGSTAQASSTSSSPLFTYRGLFDSPDHGQPVVQLDEPLFRLAPPDRYDSDMDSSLDSGSLAAADGADTPTSSASSSSSFASGASSAATSAKSDLALETLVRSLLGQDSHVKTAQGQHGDGESPASLSTARDYSMTKDYRWELADRWATSGLQSFPAPWAAY